MEKLTQARQVFKRVLVALAVFSLVVNLLMLTMPLYMLQIYDRVLTSQNMDTLVFLSIISAAALVVLGALEAIRGLLASRAGAKLETILGADALRLGLRRDIGPKGAQAIRNLSTVRAFISSRGVFALIDFPFSPIFIAILYFIHPILFWMTAGGAVLLFILALLNQWITSKASELASARQSSAFAVSQSLSANAEALQAMGMERNGIDLWGGQNAEALKALDVVDGRNAILTGISRTFRMGLQIAILGVGALLVLRGEMTAGMIFAASIISGRGLQPIDQVIGGWKQTVMAWRAWTSLRSALVEAGPDIKRTSLPAPKGNITVDGALVLGPGGPSDPPIINRVSFAVAAGDSVGVVGPSGSGKSTLARLLVGAQKPTTGTVRIDGTDIGNWDPIELGQHIGYLGQTVDLLPGTIAQNIARLTEFPDDAKVLEAAEKAHVHELIQKLPNGYDTHVGPGGTGLSGGQKQRIGLARAFYGNPQIMVLDEPNANLDEDGEAALHRALMLAKQAGVTIIVITQRAQALAVVDKVLRLHQGSKDFYGTRDEFAQALQKIREAREQQAAARANPNPAEPSKTADSDGKRAANGHATPNGSQGSGPQSRPIRPVVKRIAPQDNPYDYRNHPKPEPKPKKKDKDENKGTEQ
ncbi:MAG: type I secretion system permease/ATPase [Ahrensia sp.]|nr:type I secretion system permease/ATPase [Ahrensia sp.]